MLFYNHLRRATLSLLGFLALVATLHEGLREFWNRPIDLKVESLPTRLLNCFSVLNNSRKILSAKVNSSDNLGCLNGIRVLSTTWVVMGHTYFQATMNPIYDGILLYNVYIFKAINYDQFASIIKMTRIIGSIAVAISWRSHCGNVFRRYIFLDERFASRVPLIT